MKRIFKILSVFFLVVIALLIICAVLLITPREHVFLNELSIAHDNELSGKMFDTLSDALVNEAGEIVQLAEITIPQEQFNAFLRTVVYSSGLKRAPDDYYVNIYTGPASLEFDYYFDLPIGGNIRFIVQCRPVIRDNQFDVIPQKIKIGHIPLSTSLTADAIAEKIREFNASDTGKKVLAAIKDISILQNGDVTLKLDPMEFSKLVLELTK